MIYCINPVNKVYLLIYIHNVMLAKDLLGSSREQLIQSKSETKGPFSLGVIYVNKGPRGYSNQVSETRIISIVLVEMCDCVECVMRGALKT